MKTAIVIPARYGSTRFPGKPLAKIAGKTMLERVVDIARTVSETADNFSFFVTTESEEIAEHCMKIGVYYIMTPESCPTGSDRVLSAMRQMTDWPDVVINLQGDVPFTPPHVISSIMEKFEENPRFEVVTPVYRLSWNSLDALREAKKTTPFSGTTAVLGDENRALWFSKNIIPAIRNEDELREKDEKSPIWQHMGLYGFRSDILEQFCELPTGTYERLEGLEQLRMLEHGIKIQAVPVEIPENAILSGIDSPEDIARAEKMFFKNKKLFGLFQ